MSLRQAGTVGFNMSRRNFLQGLGITAAGVGGAVALSGCSATESTEEESGAEGVSTVVTEELPVVQETAPEITSYDCDVLVVGGGYAGLTAAKSAAAGGATVIAVDKGEPGFSGYTSWAQGFGFISEEYGDDPSITREMWKVQSDFSANLNWFDVFAERSQEAYEALDEYGIFTSYDNMASTPDPSSDSGQTYYETWNISDFMNNFVTKDQNRHWLINTAFKEICETVVTHTMITDVIEDDGRIVGAIGLHVPSATVISFNAKAVIMCTGDGSFKPSGYPTGADTFDGNYIAYKHGLACAGMETNDFHRAIGQEPGNIWREFWPVYMRSYAKTSITEFSADWTKLMLTNPQAALEGVSQYDPCLAWDAQVSPIPPVGGLGSTETNVTTPENCPFPIFAMGWFDMEGSSDDSAETEVNSDDPRLGARVASDESMEGDDDEVSNYFAGISAPGMGCHKGQGVFTGNEATTATSIPGLYYAGDALDSAMNGLTYFAGCLGSSGSATQGLVAGEAAAEYVAGVDEAKIPDDVLAEQEEYILAPLNNGHVGYNPDWIRESILTLMTPAGVSTAKTQAVLEGTLARIEWLRDYAVPKLTANDGHEVRMCHEVKSAVLVAEMKLRASMDRKESRGLHYRMDYPGRDDENFLCNITLSQGEDGTMQVDRVPFEEEWIGDTSVQYEIRYPARFPYEAEVIGVDEGYDLQTQVDNTVALIVSSLEEEN